MSDPVKNVLFICTGNSARSILAEALVTRLGTGRFRGLSAGSQPKGQVHPLAVELLRAKGHDVSQLRSKSWDEFAGPDAPPIDYVFTVCDQAAAEACPYWPGHPATAHWGMPDPAAVPGEAEARAAFARTYDLLSDRIAAFLALPLADLDPASLRAALNEIGSDPKTAGAA